MMHFFKSLWLTALVASAAFAQSGSSAVFRADSRLVVLHATVVDGNGELVTNLGEKAFRTYEDNVEQSVKIFRREDMPVSMGIIVDNSASMKEKRQRVETAAMALVKASNPEDEVFIVNFNDEVFRDVDFTSDLQKLEAGLAHIDCRGGTAMRDAIYQSIKYMKEKARRDKKVL
ncbi:MAG: VWA domain-containing protein, partial [Bryobacteraceae bacterium]